MNFKDKTDAELWAAFQRGTVRAFTVLFERHSEALVGWLVARRGMGRADAEDIAQGAWMRAYRNRQSYSETGAAFRTWLFTIGKNLASTEWKRQKRKKLTPLERTKREGETYILPDAERAGEVRTPAEEAHERDFERRTEEAIAELSDAYRETLRMSILDGRPYKEIAEATGTPMGTVKSRMYRGREKLSEALDAFRQS